MPEKVEDIYIHEFHSDLIPPTVETMNVPKQGGAKITVIGKPGCFAKGTKVLKYDGKVANVEDIKEGDLLMGDDLSPRRVLELCRGREKMCKIVHERGSTVVNENHILSLKHARGDVLNITVKKFMNGNYKAYKWYYVEQPSFGSLSFFTQTITLSEFTIECLEEDNYYGFTLDGNHLFLLEDFSVVHNTGKTCLIDRLLYEKKHIFPVGWAMSGTEDSNSHFQDFMEPLFVYNKLQIERINTSVRRQRIAINYTKVPWAVWIADDVCDDPKIFNKPLFQGLYKNGRHWKMLWILSVQYIMDSKVYMRSNTDGVFIGRETNMENRKKLWKNYAGVVPTFELFNALMDKFTSEYEWLFIRNNYPSNKIEDLVFYWKPPPCPPNWKFGCKEYHEFAKERMNPEYVDPLY
jgi:hypothetical protein